MPTFPLTHGSSNSGQGLPVALENTRRPLLRERPVPAGRRLASSGRRGTASPFPPIQTLPVALEDTNARWTFHPMPIGFEERHPMPAGHSLTHFTWAP